MALKDIIVYSADTRKVGVSEERVEAVIPILRDYVAFFREYPDIFVDFLCTGFDDNVEPTFKLYYYQRLFLRVACRYKYVYAVFARAFSKSMLAVLSLMIRCILYPGAKLFVAAGGKEQSSGIMKEKVEELCNLIPPLEREIDWRRGKGTTMGKDYCRYQFKNGSWMDNLVARESSRGKRRNAGVLEECVSIDGEILNAVLIPRYWGLAA